MIEEILGLVERKIARRWQPAVEKHHWERLRHAIRRASEGGAPGWPRRPANDEDHARWALNCALLINGLSFHWMPLVNSRTMKNAKGAPRRRLPRDLHNMMVLSPPNDSTRGYISLVNGGWRGQAPNKEKTS